MILRKVSVSACVEGQWSIVIRKPITPAAFILFVFIWERKGKIWDCIRVYASPLTMTSVVASANPRSLLARQVYFPALSLLTLLKMRHPFCWDDGTKVRAVWAFDHTNDASASQQSLIVDPKSANTWEGGFRVNTRYSTGKERIFLKNEKQSLKHEAVSALSSRNSLSSQKKIAGVHVLNDPRKKKGWLKRKVTYKNILRESFVGNENWSKT